LDSYATEVSLGNKH